MFMVETNNTAALESICQASDAVIRHLISLGFECSESALTNHKSDDSFKRGWCYVLLAGKPIAKLDGVPYENGRALPDIADAAAAHKMFLSFEG